MGQAHIEGVRAVEVTLRSPGSRKNPLNGLSRSALWLTVASILMMGVPAWAHVSVISHFDDDVWNVWSLTPDILIATALISAIYITGFVRRSPRDQTSVWRHVSFASGVGSVFLALATPLDYISEHLFAVHQIQHILLRMVAPMLIALAAPQAMLTRGLPAALRHNVLSAVVSNSAVQWIFSRLTEPVLLTVLFIAALYVWQYPPYHNAALLNETIHYIMHITMLLAGLLFWWRIFDRRPEPHGLRFGVRLMMLWIVMLSNIALGAYTTIKDELLYPAYDVVGRLFDVTPLTDEKVGGFIIWMPSSMMCIVAMIVVIHLWGNHETHVDERRQFWVRSGRAVAHQPTTGAQMIAQAAPKNRVLAIGFGVFAISMFAAAILIGVLDHLDHERSHGQPVHLPYQSQSSMHRAVSSGNAG